MIEVEDMQSNQFLCLKQIKEIMETGDAPPYNERYFLNGYQLGEMFTYYKLKCQQIIGNLDTIFSIQN